MQRKNVPARNSHMTLQVNSAHFVFGMCSIFPWWTEKTHPLKRLSEIFLGPHELATHNKASERTGKTTSSQWMVVQSRHAQDRCWAVPFLLADYITFWQQMYGFGSRGDWAQGHVRNGLSRKTTSHSTNDQPGPVPTPTCLSSTWTSPPGPGPAGPGRKIRSTSRRGPAGPSRVGKTPGPAERVSARARPARVVPGRQGGRGGPGPGHALLALASWSSTAVRRSRSLRLASLSL